MSILPPQHILHLRHADLITNLEDKMDGIKSATGLGNNSTNDSQKLSGEEPLAGQKGKGTLGEPYDLGNQEGSEGAPAKEEGVSGVLGDTKRKAEDLVGKGS